ncbi:MAG: DsrE family protein [Planctomyces sp.]|nr:DsrE family protein [Planctomyces sp.]
MTNRVRYGVTVFLLFAGFGASTLCWPVLAAQTTEADAVPAERQKLIIVWTSGDPEVAHRMVLMYGHAAMKNKWFDEVRVIIWGPSSRLTAADKEIQSKLMEMKADGVVLQACIVCADSYGVTDGLRGLGIEVKPMGKPLSETIKDSSTHLVTF